MVINNGIRIPCTIDTLFKRWFEFLEPIHHLTKREQEIIAAFVKERYFLSKKITDEKILDDVLMSDNTKKKICADCGMTFSHLQVMLGKFRKGKLIINNRINPKFIPNISEENGMFKLLLMFDLSS